MPAFDEAATSPAPPEEVWKLLYDPTRFPEWWSGLERVEDVKGDGFTVYPDGYPDFPMPQKLETRRTGRHAVISCLVSNMRFEWQLEEEADGGTRISIHVEIPEDEAARLDDQRAEVSRSLQNLARVAQL
jgi:uncharacterized protein YndB with AHSA1/START domain